MQCDKSWRFFCTLGNFLKPFATMNLPKSPFIDIWQFLSGHTVAPVSKSVKYSVDSLIAYLRSIFLDNSLIVKQKKIVYAIEIFPYNLTYNGPL